MGEKDYDSQPNLYPQIDLSRWSGIIEHFARYDNFNTIRQMNQDILRRNLCPYPQVSGQRERIYQNKDTKT